ncbi:phospholipase [Streptomyces sp. NPDC016309]|uniref:phospholipase n=1 Tax=Streptomyces sp. NPDC016309 TaxID=3364965 RepID=UPI0036FC8A86
MKRINNALLGATLGGVMAFSLATPALADSAPAAASTPGASAAAVEGESVAAAVTRQQKLNRLKHLTEASQDALGDWTVDRDKWRRTGSNRYGFNWNTDGCSGASDNPGGFHFWSACARHDFGYRNYKGLNAFSAGNKKRVDKTFLYDMNNTCDHQWGPYTQAQRKACKRVAKKYYDAVVALGHL